MKPIKLSLFVLLVLLQLTAAAQTENPQDVARAFMRSGDWDNAILVLNKALETNRNNTDLQKDLTLAYFYKRDFAKALETVKPLLDDDNADVTVYQMGGNIYKALEEQKDADKLYKRGLKRFPKSGALHSEYGELQYASGDNTEAIETWEEGIKADPGYSGNYYNAARYYFDTKDKVWSLLYGEIFVNMESLTERATAMKGMLLQGYREKLFADNDILTGTDKNTPEFAKAWLQTMGKQSSVASRGISAETLTMVRTRAILDWYKTYAGRFPFKLFDYQQQLIREGMFEAYNQWLFGTVENLAAYDNWTRTHAEAYAKFTAFQKNRIFKMPAGQYYASF